MPTQLRYAFSATAFALASVIIVRQYEARQAALNAPIPKLALHPTPGPDAGRPPRSPQTDPSMSATGPRVGPAVNVRGTTFREVSTNGDEVITSEEQPTGSVAYVTKLAAPSEPQELFRIVGGRLAGMLCVPDKYSPLCLLEEERSTGGDAGVKSVFTLFDRQTKKLTPVEGPWGDHGWMAHVALAFNGRWIALGESRPSEAGSVTVHHFVEIGARLRYVRSVAVGDPVDLVAYGGTAEAPKAIVRLDAPGSPSRYESIDVVRGTRAKVDPPASSAEPSTTSGDGRLRFVCREHAGIDVEEIATKKVRSFEIHPDDRARLGEGCGQWLDDRYIELALDGIVWLDTRTMKYAFVSRPDEEGWQSLGDRWALRTQDGALWLAPILLPPD